MSATMPWEVPLCKLATSLTGNTAQSIAAIALFVTGGLLVFKADLGDFAKRIVNFTLAASVMICASSFLSLFKTNTITSTSGGSAALSLPAPVILSANINVQPYKLITQSLGRKAVEIVGCHSKTQPIQQAYDHQLNKETFVIVMNDACDENNQQTIKIGANDDSSNVIKGFEHDKAVYRWKFKLDKQFTAPRSFSSIHQIKAEGLGKHRPIINVIPYASPSGSEQLMVVYYPPSEKPRKNQLLTSIDLNKIKGKWIEVYEKIIYGEKGSYAIKFRELNTSNILLAYSASKMDTWIKNTSYMRPQWGLGGQSVAEKNNEQSALNAMQPITEKKVSSNNKVIFLNDFCFSKGSDNCSEIALATSVPAVAPSTSFMKLSRTSVCE